MSLEQLLAWMPPGSPDEGLARQVNFDQLPAHIAIIMDGNGRWAAQRHLPRVEGHRAGIESVRDVVEASARIGIDVLTRYAFSVENWKRPRAEINTLMTLLKRYLRLELTTLLSNNIRFHVIGRHEELASDVRHELEIGIRQTATNTGMQFNISLNYGGRAEIVDAARREPTVRRVLSGAVLIAITVAVGWLAPGWLFFAVAELVLLLAYVEYARLADACGLPIPKVTAGAATVLASIGVSSSRWTDWVP